LADHNEQHDEYHDIPDDEWANILARCAAAKIDADQHVSEVETAYLKLTQAQQRCVRSLRAKIAGLDFHVSAPG